jgi:hypothetical protein
MVPGCEGVGVFLKVNEGGSVWRWGCREGHGTTRFSPGAREEGVGEWVKAEEGFDGGVPGGVV